MHCNPTICTACGGQCCKRAPGVCYPSDFGLPGSSDTLVNALLRGRYCIDYWEGDLHEREGDDNGPTAYFVRPAYKGDKERLVHAGWGGECTFLTNAGCSLAPEQRPTECRHLVPAANHECTVDDPAIGKRNAAIAWLLHHKLLQEIVTTWSENLTTV
jgi:hypothetical protein